jgi:hypothetical protein
MLSAFNFLFNVHELSSGSCFNICRQLLIALITLLKRIIKRAPQGSLYSCPQKQLNIHIQVVIHNLDWHLVQREQQIKREHWASGRRDCCRLLQRRCISRHALHHPRCTYSTLLFKYCYTLFIVTHVYIFSETLSDNETAIAEV